MKLSNALLGLIAAALLMASALTLLRLSAATPTAVINIQLGAAGRGGGWAVEVPRDISSRQAWLLAMADEIARRDGLQPPQLLQGIILQETLAGGLRSYKVAGHELGLKPNDRYYGVAQLKLSAARDVLRRNPALWEEFNFQTRTDEEIIAKLIEDDRFNLTVASRYLLILRDVYGYNTTRQLALAYNQGPTGARQLRGAQHPYPKKVMRHLQRL